jgi:branched-chain amino acid transport system ATP-binding protein
LLKISNLSVYYKDLRALDDVSLVLSDGEIVSVIGSNGAGKSTLLNAISGIIKPKTGRFEFAHERIDGLPSHRVVEKGIVQVPEGRKIFYPLTVLENLFLGSYLPAAKKQRAETIEKVFGLFPILKERQGQLAGTLSGGEQQMLAIGRGLMAKPKLLILDEPSLGLSPRLVGEIFAIVKEINQAGISILLVEQNVVQSLALANLAYVLENGRIVLEGPGSSLIENPRVREAYLALR